LKYLDRVTLPPLIAEIQSDPKLSGFIGFKLIQSSFAEHVFHCSKPTPSPNRAGSILTSNPQGAFLRRATMADLTPAEYDVDASKVRKRPTWLEMAI
jgi:hypothetical protein